MHRSVVVTGANSGIGLAAALELAAAGWDVTGTVRSEAKAEVLRSAAAARGLAVATVLCDVADAASTEKAFAEVAERTGGGPWAVVNNAGFAQGGAVEDVDDDAARAQLETNLLAPMRIARLVLPTMRARGGGRIVNVSSIAGRVTSPLFGWYCASKRGLEAITDALRMEVASFGVKVVLIEPGGFGTGIWADGVGRIHDVTASPYAAAYAKGIDMTMSASARMPAPTLPARVIRLALETAMPLPRYLVGWDAVGGTAAEELLPTAVTDLVKRQMFGLRGLRRR